MDLYCLDHLCSFWTLGRMNNRITEKSNFEKGPAINLNPNSAIELVRTLSPWGVFSCYKHVFVCSIVCKQSVLVSQPETRFMFSVRKNSTKSWSWL